MMSASIPVALLDRLADETLSPRESVYRELRRLFNTRAPKDAASLPALLAWGVPEWHGINADDDRVLDWFCRQLRRTILHLEPRIKALTVSVKEARHTTLALHLEAQLRDDDALLALDLAYQNGRWR